MRTALARGASALPRAGARELTSERTLVPFAALCAFAALTGAIRLLLGTQFPTPYILVDELIHAELAESLVEDGRFHVRGAPITVTFLYPLLIAPAWLADSLETTYALAKAINVLLMTLVAVPVWLWGKRLLSPAGAAVAAALSLLLPSLALTGTLMQENAFLPAFVLAAFAMALTLERPTATRQLLALLAIALAALVRVQGLLLLPIFLTAILLYRPPLRSFRTSAVALALAGLAVLPFKGDSLGVYSHVRSSDYSLGEIARWTGYGFGELALSVGFLPLCALIILLSRRCWPEGRVAPERAFLAVTVAATGWLLLLAGVSASWLPEGIKERYVFHVAPLLFLALAVWVERGLPRPRLATALAVALPGAAAVALPFAEIFRNLSFVGNAFAVIPLWRLSTLVPGDATGVAWVVLGGASLAAWLVALAPRALSLRLSLVLLPAFLVASSISVTTTLASQSGRVRDLAGLGSDPSWLDERVGRGAEVLFLNTTAFEPDTQLGRWFEAWVPVWESELWNRSFGGVHNLGPVSEPSPLQQSSGGLDWASGRVLGPPATAYAVLDRRFELAGVRLAETEHLALFRVAHPLRLAGATEGVYRDGSTGTLAAYDRWTTTGRSPGRLVVEVERTVQSAVATVRLGALGLDQNGLATIAGEARTTRVVLPAGRRTRVTVSTPPPPFRAELRLSAAGRGAVVHFRMLPPARG